MREILIACEMLRDELELAMEQTQKKPKIMWLEKGLHNEPKNLHKVLQETINQAAQTYDHILLGMAYCGGAMNGIGSRTATVVVPRFDDCIRLLLALEQGKPNSCDCHCLYFTKQWMISDCYIVRELEKYCRTYGEKRGKRIMRSMLANYRGLHLLDTGAYDISDFAETAAKDAQQLGLEYGQQPGTSRILEKLLLHQFDDEFCVALPGQTLTQGQFLCC